ncbi:MAG: hemolysin III family protein [Dokdonella sp.]
MLEPRYMPAEEVASSAIHGLGIVLGVGGLLFMVAIAARHGDGWDFGASIVYGISLLLLSTASTLYYGIPNAAAKPVLRLIDHASIHVLIAGSCTPYALISLRGSIGYTLFAIMWTIAVVGIATEMLGLRRRGIRVALYLGPGWIGLIAAQPLYAGLTPAGFWLLIGGGLCCSVGVPFYMAKRMHYNHATWHAFVLAGSMLHFLSLVV